MFILSWLFWTKLACRRGDAHKKIVLSCAMKFISPSLFVFYTLRAHCDATANVYSISHSSGRNLLFFLISHNAPSQLALSVFFHIDLMMHPSGLLFHAGCFFLLRLVNKSVRYILKKERGCNNKRKQQTTRGRGWVMNALCMLHPNNNTT